MHGAVRKRMQRLLVAWLCLNLFLVPINVGAGEIFPCPSRTGLCELVDGGLGGSNFLLPILGLLFLPGLLQGCDGNQQPTSDFG